MKSIASGPLRTYLEESWEPQSLCTKTKRLCTSWLRNSLAPYRARNPKNREKRVSESKTPIPRHPGKGRTESKNPHFPCSALYRNGDFLTQSALFLWGGREMGFLTLKPSFPNFGDFGPVRGKRIPKSWLEKVRREKQHKHGPNTGAGDAGQRILLPDPKKFSLLGPFATSEKHRASLT